MRVVLAEDGSIEREALGWLLKGAGLIVVGEGSRWDALAELVSTKTPDLFVVVVGSDPHLVDGLSSVARTVPTVVVSRELPASWAEQIAVAGAYGIVPFDAGSDALHAVAAVAVGRANDLTAARKEAVDFKEQLETRKLVERAKGILMRRLGISEPDAFRRLQKASQDENKRMGDIAQAIVHAEKVFGGKSSERVSSQPEHRAAR
jgi:two-component system, response regulator PdtaR